MLPLSAADNASTNGSEKCCFCCLKDDQGKIKTNTLVNREGSGAGSIQMDTLDTVKSSRRQQAAEGENVRRIDSIFLAEGMACQNYLQWAQSSCQKWPDQERSGNSLTI